MSNHNCKHCGSSNTEEDPVVITGGTFFGATLSGFNPFSSVLDDITNVARKGYEAVSGKQRYYCNNCKKHFYIEESDDE